MGISMQLAALSALLVIASVPMGVLAAQADPGLFDLQSEENIALREEQGSMGASSLQKMQKLKQKALHQASREVKVKQQRKAEQATSNSISDGQTSAMLALGTRKRSPILRPILVKRPRRCRKMQWCRRRRICRRKK